jgi:tetratricopeptide (TPR) repeat protein
VRAWAALRVSSAEGRFEAMHATGLTDLVGREEELDLLLRRWSKAKTGEGQVVLLSGEAGIGKSRLTAALLERLASEPHTRLRYFCSPQHTDSAFYPIISQTERAAGLAHDDTLQAKLDKLDAVLAQTSTPIQDAGLLVGLSNVRLRPGPGNALEVEQPGGRTDKHGQFLFAVEGSQQSPDDLFAQAQSAEQSGDIVEAERLYRLLIESDPADASAPFNLGNMLRAKGRNVEAEAAFRLATRTDPTFAQAWYNLGDLLDDQGRTDSAIECLRKALQTAPDYADAMFNLALLLQRTNHYAEARDYWRRYLANDSHSDWAIRARRSLKFCEMQSHLSASA